MTESQTKKKFKNLIKRLRKDWDLSEYKEFFPTAREMKRSHLFFVGPTNSGKSYRGFNELVAYRSGAYLAPLRLLALEGQEEIEKRGKTCSLLTGEELDLKPGAQFVASTIEMADLDNPIESVLIDEVQLILDENRGWAWSQAIVGAPASRILMTGSEDCLPTIQRLIQEYLQEELEIVYLNRMSELEVLKKPLLRLPWAHPGTAIIAFSRRAVLAIKRELEDAGRSVSVLYGNLSPGVRREEAKRFRSGQTEILVATDCIGMGLNLPIQTVVFSEIAKFDGKEVRMLNIQEIKQIAGRAGRYGQFEAGFVAVTHPKHTGWIRHSIKISSQTVLAPCFVRPTQTQLEILQEQIGDNNMKSALLLFTKLSKNDSVVVCSDLNEMLGIAEKIENTPHLSSLHFSDKYLFVCAPVSPHDYVVDDFMKWLILYSKGLQIVLSDKNYTIYLKSKSTSEDSLLNAAENTVKSLTLYHWLARKKPIYFPSLQVCELLRDQINSFIENSLKQKGLHWKCSGCFKKIALHSYSSVNKLCKSCFNKKKFAD